MTVPAEQGAVAAGATTPVAAAPAKGAQTPFRRLVSEFAESKLAVGAFVTLVAIILAALLAPWITPQNPYDLAQISILDGRLEPGRSEEHTSELQSLMRISYAVLCLK